MDIDYDKRSGKRQVRWRDSGGKKHRDPFTWDNERDAKLRKKELERQTRNNALGLYKEILLRDAFVIFKKHILPKLASDVQRHNCEISINQINATLGDLALNKITYTHIVNYWQSFLERGRKPSTANKSMMWIGNLFERFRLWNAMVPEMMPEKVALPETNPVKVAKEYLGRKMSELPYRRKRVPTREELKQAKAWCLAHSPQLWEDMKKAMLFSLRKSDLLSLRPGAKVEGIQGKTLRPFNLPFTMDGAVNSTGLRDRWDALRKAQGWDKTGTPKHTTWHDLRHCGPTMIAEMGYSSKIIQSILGHATEEQSMTYTNVRAKALAPALDALKKEIESI